MLNSVFSFKKVQFSPSYAKKYIQIFSHPRSGTHLLEAFIGENFYKNIDISLKDIIWGHWADRQKTNLVNPYGKLFGSHIFPTRDILNIDYPSIYIYRDGRAVSYSIWKTLHFLHPKYNQLSFSNFLRTRIDWIGSPAFKCKPKMTIGEHWSKHVSGWLRYGAMNKNILIVKYEDLIRNPYQVYCLIRQRFFIHIELKKENQINIITKPLGLLPNKAKIDAWKELFSEEDLSFFHARIDDRNLLSMM